MASFYVLSDFNGTVTEEDMLGVLTRSIPTRTPAIHTGTIKEWTLRERLQAQAASLTLTMEEAESILDRSLAIDPTFHDFVNFCRGHATPLLVVSSGITSLIAGFLERHGIDNLSVIANETEYLPTGWRLRFQDDSPSGNAKTPYVIRAQEQGYHAILIGDDESDFDASLVADERFAKQGSVLARFLADRDLTYQPFSQFAEIQASIAARLSTE